MNCCCPGTNQMRVCHRTAHCLWLHVLVIMVIMGMCYSKVMDKLSELTCFLWLLFIEFLSFHMVMCWFFSSFLKIFPNGIKIISTCCSPFCVIHPVVELLLLILRLENLLPHSLANGCVLCCWVLLAWQDILFQRQSLWYIVIAIAIAITIAIDLRLLLCKIAIPRLPDCCQIAARLPDC